MAINLTLGNCSLHFSRVHFCSLHKTIEVMSLSAFRSAIPFLRIIIHHLYQKHRHANHGHYAYYVDDGCHYFNNLKKHTLKNLKTLFHNILNHYRVLILTKFGEYGVFWVNMCGFFASLCCWAGILPTLKRVVHIIIYFKCFVRHAVYKRNCL